ncbi:MAG: ArgE/DapE family deacylase [Candidatus Promineifilaceae bacterium]
MSFSINQTFLTQTLQTLVQIDSSNPSLSDMGAGELEIATYVAEVMQQLGLETSIDVVAEGRANAVGILRGKGGGKSLMLNAHLDTVGFEGMSAPLSAEIRDGKLYGRGSQDMKCSIAASIAATKALIDANISLAGDLILTFVADEEYASIGMQDIVKRYQADGCIVTEPTGHTICTAHRGFTWYKITAAGRAAHGSRYDDGIDAIMHIGRFLGELDKLEQALRQRPTNSLAGVPSLHASMINGGTEISVYPAACELHVERRTNPEETAAQCLAEIQAIADRLMAADPNVQLTVEEYLERKPFEVATDAPIVNALQASVQAQLGESAPIEGASYWTDAAFASAAGIESVIFGPIGAGLHSAEEWVDLQSCIDVANILAKTAIAYCGPA